MDAVRNKDLEAARSGDQEAFAHLTAAHRNELLVHCYRILGSYDDAEDMLQETFVRAWQHLGSFEGRSSLRAWFYKIATNACLDALDKRKRRGLPKEMYPRGNPTATIPLASKEVVWVEPLPEEMLDGQPSIYPEARYDMRESVRLAFIAALQKLPGRQRAALLLCDVLGWNSVEAAEILDMTVPAVNSALQRAREAMKQSDRKSVPTTGRLSEQLNALLARYVAAWEAADSAALVAVLREDVALTMPPIPVWFQGRADIKAFLDGFLFRTYDPFRVKLVPIRASGSPAYAVYQREVSGVYRAAAIHVLTIEHGGISEINDYLSADGKLFIKYHLPVTA